MTSLRLPSCALGARLFPPSKWAGLFPSAAYRRSAPPQLAVGILTPCGLGCFNAVGRFCGIDEWADSHFPCLWWAGLSLVGWEVSMWLEYFCSAKGQRVFKHTPAVVASHEARRRMAVYAIQLAGSRTRSASRGTRRATAVKHRPSRFPTSTPAPYRRGVGCRASPCQTAERR